MIFPYYCRSIYNIYFSCLSMSLLCCYDYGCSHLLLGFITILYYRKSCFFFYKIDRKREGIWYAWKKEIHSCLLRRFHHFDRLLLVLDPEHTFENKYFPEHPPDAKSARGRKRLLFQKKKEKSREHTAWLISEGTSLTMCQMVKT